MELGVYSFGNTPRLPDGSFAASAEALRNLLEAVKLADEVGLDFFGFGEHHVPSMPLSSPTALVNAAATVTRNIRLGTAVSILSSDDPIRVYQQLATADAFAPGRIEIVAGRGSSTITFPLFDYDESDYEALFESKLDLLVALNGADTANWSGPHRRRPLKNAHILPRPAHPLPIWRATGGSPDSVVRAAQQGLPLFLGILGGDADHWAQYGRFYREQRQAAGHDMSATRIAVAAHGFVGASDAEAKRLYHKHEQAMFMTGSQEIGRKMAAPPGRTADMEFGGMVFAGSAENVAERILHLHADLGHDRHMLQMDVGGMPHVEFMKSIELLGTKVAPIVRRELGKAVA